MAALRIGLAVFSSMPLISTWIVSSALLVVIVFAGFVGSYRSQALITVTSTSLCFAASSVGCVEGFVDGAAAGAAARSVSSVGSYLKLASVCPSTVTFAL